MKFMVLIILAMLSACTDSVPKELVDVENTACESFGGAKMYSWNYGYYTFVGEVLCNNGVMVTGIVVTRKKDHE